MRPVSKNKTKSLILLSNADAGIVRKLIQSKVQWHFKKDYSPDKWDSFRGERMAQTNIGEHIKRNKGQKP